LTLHRIVLKIRSQPQKGGVKNSILFSVLAIDTDEENAAHDPSKPISRKLFIDAPAVIIIIKQSKSALLNYCAREKTIPYYPIDRRKF
jgi:hypothetical protein